MKCQTMRIAYRVHSNDVIEYLNAITCVTIASYLPQAGGVIIRTASIASAHWARPRDHTVLGHGFKKLSTGPILFFIAIGLAATPNSSLSVDTGQSQTQPRSLRMVDKVRRAVWAKNIPLL